MTELWWLAERPGRTSGPFTRDQIARMLVAGELHSAEQAWSSLTKTWTDISVMAGSSPRPQRSRLRDVHLLLLAAGYAAGLTACVFLIAFPTVRRLDADFAPLVWLAAGVSLLAASLGVMKVWLRPGRWGERRPELAAIRTLVVALLGLAGVVAGSLTLYQRHDAVAMLEGLRTLPYDLGLDETGKIVQVRGFIGPGFAEALSAALRKPSAPDSIEITSLGGLTDEALTAAKQVEARHLKVIVREICASACLVVLLAGDERLADVDARLDFHATSPLEGMTSPAVLWSAEQEGKVFAAYLPTHGVPKSVLETAARIGPGQVNSLSALEALDLHLLTGVVDGEAVISRERLERALASSPRRMVRSAVYEEID